MVLASEDSFDEDDFTENPVAKVFESKVKESANKGVSRVVFDPVRPRNLGIVFVDL